MQIRVFGTETCGKCNDAKQFIKDLGLEYEAISIYHHDGWKNDGTPEAMSWYALTGTLPIISVDGEFMRYATARKQIRRIAGERCADNLGSSCSA